jgi:DNA-binding XRE family transcriptional regulator
MQTASDTAPAARGTVESGVDSKLRAERERQGLARKELAARAAMSANTLTGIENGHQRPSIPVAATLAKALRVAMTDLFTIVECECGECGELLIDMPRHGSAARFLSGHNVHRPEHGEAIASAHRSRRSRLGIPEEKICKGCGRIYTRSEVPRQRLEHWLAREYCPDGCRWPVVEPRPCEYCGEVFRPDENRRHYCPGTTHGQLARWERLTDIPDAVLKALPSRARQKKLGKKRGREFGHLGGRPAAMLTDEQRAEVEKLHARGWGRRAIAGHLLVSERAVRNALDS